jgi:stage II sporulation protein D
LLEERHRPNARLLCALQILSTACFANAASLDLPANWPGAAVVLNRKTGQISEIHNAALARGLSLAPGSAIKPFSLMALIEAHKLSPGEKLRCPGTLRIGDRNLTCSHPVLPGRVGVEEALAYSCNNFVAHFAARFGPGELARYLRKYGFSSVDSAADPRLQAIGETGVRTTVLEMARAYQRLSASAPPSVLAGLRGSIEYGTGQLARVDGIPLRGKTGTVPRHAWFAGFTPSQVIVVLVQGRAGGSDAAPVAGRILATLNPPGPGVVTVRADGQTRRIGLEDYVAAVLAGESKDFRSAEALKAMAVAARTFAVKFRGRHHKEGFDFCETTHCQHLRLDAVTGREREAAAATAGELLWYRGAPAATYYSKDCGGITETASAVWPDMAAPYLRSVRDPFCPHKSWDVSLDAAKFAQALRDNGLKAPEPVAAVQIVRRTPSGRALRLAISGAGGPATLSAGAVRFALGRSLGWSTLKSDRYEVQASGGRILFHGYGTGHGVGLCQLGADAMGSAGRSYREILAVYYPGTVAGLTAQGLRWQRLGGERVEIFSTQPSRDAPLVARADRLLARAEQQTGLHFDRRPILRIYPTVSVFRDSTGEPGWVAGDAQGRLIRLQPAPSEQTIYHELLHLVLENRANPSLPGWFREELAEYLAADAGQTARMRGLVMRYGKAAVLGWVTRGLPPELRNSSASQPARNSR